VGETVRRIVLMAAVLLPAGCSSLDSIPLSDVPIPEAAPRMAAETPAPAPPPARPQLPDKTSSSDTPVAPAPVATAATGPVPPPLFEEPLKEPAKEPEPAGSTAQAASDVKGAGEAIASAVDTLLAPRSAMAFTEEAAGSGASGEETLYRSGLVERRDVLGGEGTLAPARKPQPAAAIAPVSFSQVTISRIEIPSFNARTWIWVTIGFAALIGLFISARQISN
jgi:hypothetical protein